ncbi:4-hydroxyacetophenone monooxygenase [Leucobacter exalbidus]|uniref:4-hydroxyacetophenone monooxygenase n=1 Tax=Leucobacter exalbidus TaxID=662960 RepID=A0A940PXH3_9MICO|nr:NAD(P)/FAD-dependent oxidoreductase [Leucobacter exalbidus]MBP1325976.1 4-hydroxyacetophenone monooxygenase [Leucobacter exalbidus]
MPDRSFIERAVQRADLNALRVALFQATRDPEIGAISPERVFGPVADTVSISEVDADLIRAKAVEYLAAGVAPEAELETPTREEIDELVAMLEAREFTPSQMTLRRTIPAFSGVPFQAEWSGESAVPEGYRVAIIGAGIGGIAMGVQLARLGIPFTIFERRAEVGGVWSINTYPDAGVDTLSASYEYGFEKKYPWPAYFARQADVRAYVEHVARKHGVFEHIEFGSNVSVARFNDEAQLWNLTVRDASGAVSEVDANVVVPASGIFAQPRDLPFEGAENFTGEIVHTAQWHGGVELAGKKVAVIGNGSTGVQMLSKVAEAAESVTVYQRTPQWISPRENYGEPITEELQWLIETMPFYWNWNKYTAAMGSIELRNVLFHDQDWVAGGGQVSKRNDALRKSLVGYIGQQVGGRQDLIDQLVPDYAPMTRRPVVDNNWYGTLTRENVELVSTQIGQITQHGVTTVDGTEREVDLIIAAVGFQTEKYVWPTEFYGAGGVSLEDAWTAQGPQAHLGMTVPGFPNMFMLYGPNSQPVTGGAGLPSWFEIWSRYIAEGIISMLENDQATMEITPQAFALYNDQLHEEAQKLIYLSEVGAMKRNYYVNEFGRLQMGAPWSGERYFDLCEKLQESDFKFTARAEAARAEFAGVGSN